MKFDPNAVWSRIRALHLVNNCISLNFYPGCNTENYALVTTVGTAIPFLILVEIHFEFTRKCFKTTEKLTLAVYALLNV